MKRVNQFAHPHQFLVGMRRLASSHEGEDLYVSLETERARCPLEAHLMKVPKQCVHRRRPIARAATNGIATPLYPAQPSPTGTHSDSIAVDQSGTGDPWSHAHGSQSVIFQALANNAIVDEQIASR